MRRTNTDEKGIEGVGRVSSNGGDEREVREREIGVRRCARSFGRGSGRGRGTTAIVRTRSDDGRSATSQVGVGVFGVFV